MNIFLKLFRFQQLHKHVKLDHRRFESAHLRFSILNTLSHYPEINGAVPMYSGLGLTLQWFIPIFYETFERKYSGNSVYKLLFINQKLCL